MEANWCLPLHHGGEPDRQVFSLSNHEDIQHICGKLTISLKPEISEFVSSGGVVNDWKASVSVKIKSNLCPTMTASMILIAWKGNPDTSHMLISCLKEVVVENSTFAYCSRQQTVTSSNPITPEIIRQNKMPYSHEFLRCQWTTEIQTSSMVWSMDSIHSTHMETGKPP